MATRQQLKDEFLTCIICHEVFRDPITLHCGHTFCSQCVTAYTKTQQDAIASGSIPCSHCRGLTKVPDPNRPNEEWAGQIKTGFFVRGLIDTFTDADEVEVYCTSCEEDGTKKTASIYCPDCKKDLCKDCEKYHRKFSKGHKTQLSSEAVRMKAKTKGQICPEHDDSYIDMLCEDCDKALCQRCCIVYHRKCESIITMKQAVSKFNAFLEDRSKALDMEVEDLKTKVSLKKAESRDVAESAEIAQTELDSMCDRIVSEVRVQQAEVTQKLTQMKEEAAEELRSDIKLEEMKLEEAQQRQGLIRHALQSETDMDHYEMYKICKPGNIEYQFKVKDEAKERVIHLEYDADKGRDLLRHLQKEGMGQIKTSQEQTRSCEEKVTVDNKKYELLNEIDTHIDGLCGIALLYFGLIKVVICAGYKYVKGYYSQDGKQKQSCLYLGAMATGLCEITESQGAVSLKNQSQIVFFKVKPSLEAESTVITQRGYGDIARIDSHTMAGVFKEYERHSLEADGIDIFDMHGRILRTFGSYSFHITSSHNTLLTFKGTRLTCITDQEEVVFERDAENNVSSACAWKPDKQYAYMSAVTVEDDDYSDVDHIYIHLVSHTEEEETEIVHYVSETTNDERYMTTDKHGHFYISDGAFIKVWGFK